MADPIVNFFSSTLVGGYSDSDTELTLATGSGANLPDPSVDGEFNLVIYNESEIFVTTTFDGGSTDTRQDLASTNPEIVRVTARSGDVITVTRAQEGTTASAKAAENTYRVILASTKKVFDDINTAIANVNLTTLTGVEELTFDSTGDEEFGLPAGTTAQRPSSPSAGYMRWNSTDSRIEFYNGSRWAGLSEIGFQQADLGVAELSVTANDAVAENAAPEVEYLVIAGGGGGGNTGNLNRDGAGGAGGYRSSVSGESSGGGASAESAFEAELSTSYTVTIGAGGGANGSNSVFNTITSIGGGKGGGGGSGNNGSSGGSGGGECGGGGSNQAGDRASGTTGQGFAGGIATDAGDAQPDRGGNGGGAGQQGADAPTQSVASGVSSSITGTSVERAKGGAVGSSNSGGSNSGTGGDCQGNGGSGVVILRYPSAFTITIGAGLTASTSTVGADKVTTFTAGTDTISFS